MSIPKHGFFTSNPASNSDSNNITIIQARILLETINFDTLNRDFNLRLRYYDHTVKSLQNAQNQLKIFLNSSPKNDQEKLGLEEIAKIINAFNYDQQRVSKLSKEIKDNAAGVEPMLLLMNEYRQQTSKNPQNRDMTNFNKLYEETRKEIERRTGLHDYQNRMGLLSVLSFTGFSAATVTMALYASLIVATISPIGFAFAISAVGIIATICLTALIVSACIKLCEDRTEINRLEHKEIIKTGLDNFFQSVKDNDFFPKPPQDTIMSSFN